MIFVTQSPVALRKQAHAQYYLNIRSAHLGSGPRYSSFLKNLPTNTTVFLRGL